MKRENGWLNENLKLSEGEGWKWKNEKERMSGVSEKSNDRENVLGWEEHWEREKEKMRGSKWKEHWEGDIISFERDEGE